MSSANGSSSDRSGLRLPRAGFVSGAGSGHPPATAKCARGCKAPARKIPRRSTGNHGGHPLTDFRSAADHVDCSRTARGVPPRCAAGKAACRPAWHVAQQHQAAADIGPAWVRAAEDTVTGTRQSAASARQTAPRLRKPQPVGGERCMHPPPRLPAPEHSERRTRRAALLTCNTTSRCTRGLGAT